MIENDVVESFFRNNAVFVEAFFRRNITTDKLVDVCRAFEASYNKRPLADNPGGAGINPSFWIFLIARLLSPGLVVESGVWRGHTSWLLRKAVPEALIHSFDLRLDNLQFRDPSIEYHEQDWSESNIGCHNPDTCLAFFDDHVNQARRLREAHDRSFRRLIFDDGVPHGLVERVGIPPYPSVAMLFDSSVREGDSFPYRVGSEERSFTFTENDTFGARELVSEFRLLPDTFTHLTLVLLK